jgi:hypothetical protein
MPRKNLNESEHPSLWATVAGASVLLPARSTVNDAEVTVCEQAMFAMLVYFVMLMTVVMREAVARLPAEGRRQSKLTSRQQQQSTLPGRVFRTPRLDTLRERVTAKPSQSLQQSLLRRCLRCARGTCILLIQNRSRFPLCRCIDH